MLILTNSRIVLKNKCVNKKWNLKNIFPFLSIRGLTLIGMTRGVFHNQWN